MHWTQWMESVLIRPQGISLNMHAHAILSKIFSIMKSRSPGTRFVFIHWLSIKTIRKRKKHWHNHFENRNTVQSTYIKLPGTYQIYSNYEMF